MKLLTIQRIENLYVGNLITLPDYTIELALICLATKYVSKYFEWNNKKLIVGQIQWYDQLLV